MGYRARMVKLISLLKRKPGTTHEEFLAYWRDIHGPLIAGSSAAQYVSRYEQHPTAWPAPGSRQPEPEYDGVTIQWFESTEAFYGHMSESDFGDMIADTKKFLDTTNIVWTLTDDPTIVIAK